MFLFQGPNQTAIIPNDTTEEVHIDLFNVFGNNFGEINSISADNIACIERLTQEHQSYGKKLAMFAGFIATDIT